MHTLWPYPNGRKAKLVWSVDPSSHLNEINLQLPKFYQFNITFQVYTNMVLENYLHSWMLCSCMLQWWFLQEQYTHWMLCPDNEKFEEEFSFKFLTLFSCLPVPTATGCILKDSLRQANAYVASATVFWVICPPDCSNIFWHSSDNFACASEFLAKLYIRNDAAYEDVWTPARRKSSTPVATSFISMSGELSQCSTNVC